MMPATDLSVSIAGIGLSARGRTMSEINICSTVYTESALPSGNFTLTSADADIGATIAAAAAIINFFIS
ncbi:hypothetical protein IMSAGC016_01714 [Muribaculaceae bacterium]|nr:hypothetical protein IMSAGC016_01714 [Muribaculaceae bacterium]